MPCYHPITGYRAENGTVVFTELRRHGTTSEITIKCGQCIGCKLENSRVWAMRAVHETKLYKRNCFITLTYDEENLPHRGQLNYDDFQQFMKRLRKKYGENIRFYMCGEYGTLNGRPHYHAILFNHDWTDKKHFKKSESGESIYTSESLQRLWPHGHSSSGEATFESAAYIARYCVQKRTGEDSEEHYKRYDYLGEYQLAPEFNQMSRKPGIGGDWLKFYKEDIFARDIVIINGKETNVPKFYDKLLKKQNPERLQDLKDAREWNGYQQRADNTPERLLVKEMVTKAKIKLLERGKI
ncbi:MAG: replication initiator protein [Microviridae sp.]|nr:MAG: replication initiator protein [Microviridae sp.]